MTTTMCSTRPIFVVDYTDKAFDEVCDRLEAWQDDRVSMRTGRRPFARVGPIDRVTDCVARLPILDPIDSTDPCRLAELRVLAVSTGRESLTELLIFIDPAGLTAAAQTVARLRGRSILDHALRRVEIDDRYAVPTRAS